MVGVQLPRSGLVLVLTPDCRILGIERRMTTLSRRPVADVRTIRLGAGRNFWCGGADCQFGRAKVRLSVDLTANSDHSPTGE